MPTPEEKQRLVQLESRLDAAKKRNAPKPRVDKAVDESHLAWRMVIELVVGLLIGFGIGWGLDWLFGTLPIFLMLFTLLGLAAGIKTMLRSAQEIQDKKLAELAADDTPQGADITRSSGADTTRSSGATDQPPKPGAQT